MSKSRVRSKCGGSGSVSIKGRHGLGIEYLPGLGLGGCWFRGISKCRFKVCLRRWGMDRFMVVVRVWLV